MHTFKLTTHGGITASEATKKHRRACPDVNSVAYHKIPDVAALDQKSRLLDLNVITTHMLNEGKLTQNQIYKILDDADAVLMKEPNLIEINRKCFIFGDTHGQFYDLVSVIDSFNLNTDTLLFLGDYVDRGVFSVEVYLYLLLLKCHYPDNIFLLRGNHESERMTTYFTFKTECLFKYDIETYKRFVKSFRCLPVAALVQNSAFCCHGGISPNLVKVSDLNLINRFKEIEYSGLFCDLFWADPRDDYDTSSGKTWEHNDKRKCSVKFSYENVKNFLKENRLTVVVRAHEVQEEGYRIMKNYNNHPSLITIFSAPCYCDTYQNLGAYIEFDTRVVSITQFEAVNHPFVINGFMDGINWSFPFVSEKIVDFALELFSEFDKEEILEDPKTLTTRMALMRTEREAIDEFEKDPSFECNMLTTVEDDLDFDRAKAMDARNEAMKSSVSESSVTMNISPSLANNTLHDTSQALESADLNRVINEFSIDVTQNQEQVKVKAPKKKKSKCNIICM